MKNKINVVIISCFIDTGLYEIKFIRPNHLITFRGNSTSKESFGRLERVLKSKNLIPKIFFGKNGIILMYEVNYD